MSGAVLPDFLPNSTVVPAERPCAISLSHTGQFGIPAPVAGRLRNLLSFERAVALVAPRQGVWRKETLDADDSDARLGALMKAAQSGDRAAYADLLRRVIPTITRIVVSQRRPGVEVDDVVQDVLMSLHVVRHTYDPDRPFTPWLAAITRHRAIDFYRRKARISQHEAAVPLLPETSSADETNWEMRAKGDPELLRRAISDLPAGQRHAVELLKLGELSLKEASAASGMSIASLKVAVHRALKTLRMRLAKHESERGGHKK